MRAVNALVENIRAKDMRAGNMRAENMRAENLNVEVEFEIWRSKRKPPEAEKLCPKQSVSLEGFK